LLRAVAVGEGTSGKKGIDVDRPSPLEVTEKRGGGKGPGGPAIGVA